LPIPELFLVGGAERSGSTLLTDLASATANGFNAGELLILWRSISQGRSCTCGETLIQCSVWSEVIRLTLRSLNLSTVHEAASVEATGPRQRHSLIRGWSAPISVGVVDLRSTTEWAISEVTGCDLLVDNSKISSVVLSAARVERTMTVVHLVRDPRAVAHSQANPKVDPSDHGRLMASSRYYRTALHWVGVNLAFERLEAERPGTITCRIRYEDFVANPEHELRRAGILGAVPAGPSGGGHAVSGNPWRFSPSSAIRADERWRDDLPPAHRRTVEALTFPLMLRYGYRLTGS
jgi:hypothetical protein